MPIVLKTAEQAVPNIHFDPKRWKCPHTQIWGKKIVDFQHRELAISVLWHFFPPLVSYPWFPDYHYKAKGSFPNSSDYFEMEIHLYI